MGRAHDRVQHVDRGGAPRRPDRPDDTDVSVSERASACASRREWTLRWAVRQLPTDEARPTTVEVRIDADRARAHITYGTNPDGNGVTASLPDPSAERRWLAIPFTKALKYWAESAVAGAPDRRVCIGSCTNSRISDCARVAQPEGPRKVSPTVRVWWFGFAGVKRLAIAEGLPESFARRVANGASRAAMCIAMMATACAWQYSVSTSNRNFEGRQGKGRAHLPGHPLTAAASAITAWYDVRTML